MCFQIKLNSFSQEIDRFTIDWEDGSPVQEVPFANRDAQIVHVYNLRRFGTCNLTERFRPELLTYTKSDPKNPLANSSAFVFKFPPQSSFTISPGPTACVNDAISVRPNQCNQTEDSFDFGDGGGSGTATTHTYTTPGTYVITHRVRGECGEATSTQTITVLEKPRAVAEATAGVTVPGDPLTVCLDGGSARVIVSGLKSAGASSHQWTITGAVPFNQSGRIAVDTLTFRSPGDYTLTLRVNNACNQPDVATLRFKVVAAPQLRLTPAPDACTPFNYTPTPLLPSAAYAINGVPQTTWPFRADFGTYTVVAKLSNECGDQQLTDEFTVAAPAEITVASPAAPTTVVCAGSGPITLSASPAGGTWSGARDIRVLPQGVQFVPNTAGTFTLTYTTGSGACAKTATRAITVERLDLTLNPQPDACQAIQYTPAPTVPGATYTIDGAPVTAFPVTLDLGRHIVTASLSNSCGDISKSDTFELAAPSEVSIALPTVADTVVCVGSGALTLRASLPGGRWTGATTIADAAAQTTTFDPTRVGRVTLTYTRGEGTCARASSVAVDVQGVTVTAQPISVCAGATSVALANPMPGGTWSSPDCATCVTGSTFAFPPGGASAAATYTVRYEVTSASGCSGVATTLIEVLDPRAGFDVPGEVCTGAAVTPLLPFATPGQRVTWTVDGRAAAPPFTDLPAGPHVIEATAGLGACRDVSRQTIAVIAPPPPVEIVADRTIGCGPLEVALDIGGSTATGIDYRWSFGRGAADTLRGATVPAPITFTNVTADTLRYTVTLGSANACGDGRARQEITVYPQPLAEIGTDSAFAGCSPYRVLFSNRGSRNVDACRYFGVPGLDIRDCRDTFSLELTAIGQPRVYPIVIEARNACGTDLDTALITVLPPGIAPLFNLDDPDYAVCPGQALVFSDASTPRPSILQWDLGDGTTSTADTVRHTYVAGDTSFAVRLRVSTGCGYAEQTRVVKVLARPTGTLDVDPFACVGAEVSVGVSTAAPSVRLAFGNGQRSGAAFAKTRYDSAGTYSVTANLRSEIGCTDSLSGSIVVNPLPVLELSGGDTACVGQTLRVSAGGRDVQTLAWRFPDGAVASGAVATWRPPASGTQVGTVTGRSRAGCVDSLPFRLFVRNTPVAGFGVSGDSTCVPAEITFADASTGPGITSYAYRFGDGGTAGRANGTYTYRRGGTFDVQQIVGIDGLCYDTATVRVRALAKPSLVSALVDDRCVASDAAYLDVAVGADERIRVRGPGLDTTGGTRFALFAAGNYTVSAVTPFGCDTTAAFELTARAPIDLRLLPDTSIRFGDSLQLWSEVNYAGLSYRWVPDERFDSTIIESPWARPRTSTTYELSVSQGRCVARETVRVSVLRRDPVDAPTAFSPNGDGVNDVWELFPNASIQRLRGLSIFDRWGELVYYTEGLGDWVHGGLPLKAWDGYFRGEKVNPAVYVWLLEAETFDGEVQVMTGDLTVME